MLNYFKYVLFGMCKIFCSDKIFLIGCVHILCGCSEHSFRKNTIQYDGTYLELIPSQYVYPLTGFEVLYNDGNKSISKATSIVYSKANDSIYFIGQFQDTLQIVPKAIVKDVRQVSDRIIK